MRQRLSYANVMASVAVFIALGGSSYAAIKITGKDVKNGTLTGADVKNNSLTGADIRADALNSDDVQNGSLLANDFKAGQLPAGPRGPKGDTGTVDTSNFFNKAQSDARFVQGGGRVQRVYNSGANFDIARDVPSVGKFAVDCVAGKASISWFNLSGAPQSEWRERASTSQVEFEVRPDATGHFIFLQNVPTVADRITLQEASASASVNYDIWVVADGVTCTFNVKETLG